VIYTVIAHRISTPVFPIIVIYHELELEINEVAFTISKTKTALNAKSKAHKKLMGHKVSLAAMAATAPDDLLGDMKLERRAIKSLKGLRRRVRRTEADQLERVTNSLRTHGQRVPILISPSGKIINGHIVAKALESLGASEVWCVVIDDLDERELELLHVTLNRLGETGDWDIEALGPLLIEFDDLGFDLGTTGFSLPELDIIMTPRGQAGESDDYIVPPLPKVAVTLPNDLWKLGRHRILCADSTDPISYTIVLNGELVDIVFTDCPWNIPIEGFVSGLGKTKHKDFKMGAGELSAEDFASFCNLFHQLCANYLGEGAAFYSCIDWRSVDLIMAAGKLAGLWHANTIIWNKGSGSNGTPYRPAHELIVMFIKGSKLAVNNVEMGKHGRDRTNVWSYPGANQPGSSAAKALEHHPTPKPIEMVEDALKDVSKRGALVLDVFLGSGTTLLAAERCGRRAYCIELDPAYVDVAIRRWEAMTGKEAIHAESGRTFAQMAIERETPAQKYAA